MVAGNADSTPGRPRPRPAGESDTSAGVSRPAAPKRRGFASLRSNRNGRQLARVEPPQPAQVVAAAGGAIVSAARVGRLLGRSGWRIARQLPGVSNVERIGQNAAAELGRLLEIQLPVNGRAASGEEQRVMRLVQDADTDPEPLRTAMTELLDRSVESDGPRSREYLFGTIVSQLVPDEARMLAALATGRCFAAVDVAASQRGRAPSRPVLSNVSTLGAAAGISLPQNGPTYLTRLQGLGLVDAGPPTESLESQYESLLTDPAVSDARSSAESARQGSVKIIRKTVMLSPLGREFWTACAPGGHHGPHDARPGGPDGDSAAR